MKTIKKLPIIIILVILIAPVQAITWEHQRRIAREIGLKHDFTNFRYAYYQECPEKYGDCSAVHFNKIKGENLIVFYEESLMYDEEEFECLVLHELGHENEAIKFNKKGVSLSENYADDFMQGENKDCERWY